MNKQQAQKYVEEYFASAHPEDIAEIPAMYEETDLGCVVSDIYMQIKQDHRDEGREHFYVDFFEDITIDEADSNVKKVCDAIIDYIKDNNLLQG